MDCGNCKYFREFKIENLIYNDPAMTAGKIPYRDPYTIEGECEKNGGLDCPYID
jgi:hypothetical protein